MTLMLEGVVDDNEKNNILNLGKMALTHMDPVDFKRRFKDGRMRSNPGLSNAVDGGNLLQVFLLLINSYVVMQVFICCI